MNPWVIILFLLNSPSYDFEIGGRFESFSENYTIVDTDTTEVSAGENIILRGKMMDIDYLSLDFLFDNSLYLDRRFLQNTLWGELSYYSGVHNLSLSTELSAKGFFAGKREEYESGYIKNKIKLSYGRTFDIWDFTFYGEYKIRNYKNPVSYYYNAKSFEAGITVEREIKSSGMVEGGYIFNSESVPDNNLLDFMSHRITLFFMSPLILDYTYLVDNDLEYRRYIEDTLSYWDDVLSLNWSYRVKGKLTVEAENQLEIMRYLKQSASNFNYWKERISAGVSWDFHPLGNFAVLPSFEYMNTTLPESEEDYREPALATKMDIWNEKLWLNLTNEVGYRDFLEIEDGYSLNSDYLFDEISFWMSIKLPYNIKLDGFLIFEKTWHKEEDNNTTTYLLSLEIRYSP